MEDEFKRMAGGGLLALNFCMYVILCSVAGWALDNAIEYRLLGEAAIALPVPYWSLYFPMGNAATGYFVIFVLVAAVVGAASCIFGITSLRSATSHALSAATSFLVLAWSLTLLAMGVACKEIHLHGRNSRLKTLEAFSIILSATQLLGILLVLSVKGHSA